MQKSIRVRLSFKLFLMTFAVLMVTFFTIFTAIEFLLPRLYRQEFVRDYHHLIAELQDELVNELQEGLTFQINEMLEPDIGQIAIDLEDLTSWYKENCELLLDDETLQLCERALAEIGFHYSLTAENGQENRQFVMHRPMEWFHFRQMRDHHVQYGSTPYLVIAHILNNFATTNNVRIIVWDIPEWSLDLGETLFYIEGRSAEMEFMTALDDTEIGVREQRFHDFETGGFAIAVSGTFQPAYRILNIISTLQRQLLIAIFFVSLIVSLLFSRYVAHPIVALSAESKKLRKLQFNENLKIKRRDEIGDLSSNLNYMSYTLKHALDELQATNEKLKIEMEREREQERQRRNLFTSISHELKTPITILKGEIGGMIDEVGAYKDRDTYLESAYGWIESLEKLVSEILTISRLEGEKMKLNFVQTNISALLVEICQIHQLLADKQQLLFNQELSPNLNIHADESQLQIAISNVINNAIFYTQPGKLVDVELKQEGEFAILTITNTGAQIETEDLKQLFNPFYRIDKSRNRHTGGSGLGLFIVKNILELHQFEYAIENVEEGVRFTITMPLN